MKIKIERDKCIGCGSCAAICPLYFKMADDGKSEAEGGAINKDNVSEKEIEKLGCAEDAASGCPAQCIHIEK